MSEKPTVLIVDDDLEVLAIMGDFLQEKGYVTKIAEDGLVALGFLEKQEVDVAVIDLNMPGIDGMELCREIRKMSSRTEVIIVTGHSSIVSAVTALREGAFDYILKPFDLVKISHSVKQALEKQDLFAQKERLIEELSAANRELRQKEKELEKKVRERTWAIRQSERRWRTLFENANDAIFTMDKSGFLKLFNPEAERFSGYKAEEVEGKSLKELVCRGSKKKVGALLDRTMMEGATVFGQEVKVRCKDGSELIIEINTAPLYDENSQITGVLATARDITERKQAERKLRELNRKLSAKNREMKELNRSLIEAYAEVRTSRDTFHHLLDGANNAVLFLKLNGTITGVNAKTRELFGYSRDEILKMGIYHLMSQGLAQRTKEMFKRLRMGLSDSFETEIITKDKEVLNKELNASIIEQAKKKTALIFFREPVEKLGEKVKD
jgi:PAS domain S-box-containing protein